MSGIFDSEKLAITCKNCGRETKKTIAWLKTHDQFTCKCGTLTRLDKSEFTGNLRKADEAIAAFKRKIKLLNKLK